MKIGSQKTEFQGEFGARHEKNPKKNQKKQQKSIKLPGHPDWGTQGSRGRHPAGIRPASGRHPAGIRPDIRPADSCATRVDSCGTKNKKVETKFRTNKNEVVLSPKQMKYRIRVEKISIKVLVFIILALTKHHINKK